MRQDKQITGHIISHTHWDREWRAPLWGSRFQLKKMMDELLDMLENDPDYNAFLFDGQVIAVEDYLELSPEKTEIVRKAVESGKLFIGPWYNLPDFYPVCGEALVRNLLWGTQKAEALGGCLDIGYTTFGWGQTAQFPQLLAGFGIDFIVAGKNVSKTRAPYSEFLWEAPDGTRLMTTRLGVSKRNNFYFHMLMPMLYGKMYTDPSWGYQLGKNGFLFHTVNPETCCTELTLLSDMNYHGEMISPCLEDLLSTANHTLVPNHLFLGDGTDFSGATPGLKEIIQKLNAVSKDVNFIHSTLPDYVAAVKENLNPDKLTIVQGELRDGPIAAVSGNALAVRMNLKTLNREAQTLLCRYAEPFANLIESPDGLLQQKMLQQAWSYLLKSHSHDAINGVTTDKTADDIAHRLRQVIELSELIFNTSAQAVLSRIDLCNEPENGLFMTLFNPLPTEVSGEIEAVIDIPFDWSCKQVKLEELDGTPLVVQSLDKEELTAPVNVPGSRALPWRVDRHHLVFSSGTIPAMGYKTVRLLIGETFDRTAAFWPVDKDYGTQMTGPNRMENEYMEVVINGDGTLDVTNRQTGRIYKQLNFFEYSGDAGDYWQRLEPKERAVITTLGKSAGIRRTIDGPLMTQFKILQTLEVPAGVDRKTSRLKEETVPVSICSTVTLKKNSRYIEVETILDNRASDCRFRVGLPTGLQADMADAEGHFVVDRRPIALPRDEQGCCDAQMTTLPMQHWVDLSDGENGFAVLNRNLQEFEVTNDSSRTLMLTLMRCVPMRICAEYRAPQTDSKQQNAQMHGKTVFKYALYPHSNDWKQADVYGQAERFNISPRLFQHSRPEQGDLSPEGSFLELDGAIHLSAVKRSADGTGMVVRVFNPTSTSVSCRVSLRKTLTDCEVVRMDESCLSKCSVEKNIVNLEVAPCKIETLKFLTGQG